MAHILLLSLLANHLFTLTQASLTQVSGPISCSPRSDSEDACSVPKPNGLFIFKQRFQPDVGGDFGSWGIDGIDVLQCGNQEPANKAMAVKYSHEEVASFCYRSQTMGENGIAQAEKQWAQSELGEGLEEVWERNWNSAGRFISTLGENCVKKEDQVPLFFKTLSDLQSSLKTDQWLADANIYPSEDTSYSLSELTSALSIRELEPVVMCNNMTLSSVYWPVWTMGTFQSGNFVPASTSKSSNCPTEGILYPPTPSRPAPTITQTWDPIYRPSPRPITLSHDESKQYPYPSDEKPTQVIMNGGDQKAKLEFFKGGDKVRESGKESRFHKQWSRDEL